MANSELFEALTMLAKEKGIETEQLIDKIRTAIGNAVKKDYPRCLNTRLDIDPETQKFEVCILKEVVEEVEDDDNQISLENAQKIAKRSKVGDMCAIKLDTKQFGRVAATTAKQVMKQGIREAEKDQLLEQWGNLQNEAISVNILKVEPATGNAVVMINGKEITFFRNDQLPADHLEAGDIVKVFVSGVSSADKRPILKLSRTANDLVKRLFEIEVPEIYDGTVEIKAVSREAGSRSKIAVVSNDPNVDAVGSCIGPSRSRVSKVCAELMGEKVDIVNYSEDPAEFIKQALKPADVISVEIPDEAIRSCTVTVPDNQLSLAIGNKGQNAKLAARLTGFKIDIKPESGFFEG